jgi:hypothetical protein
VWRGDLLNRLPHPDTGRLAWIAERWLPDGSRRGHAMRIDPAYALREQ